MAKSSKILRRLLKEVRNRRKKSVLGLHTADRYCAEIVQSPAEFALSGLASDPAKAAQMLKDAESKLTYCAPGARVNVRSIKRPRGNGDDVRPVLMTFDAVVTTSRRDRDGDVLNTKGATVDDRMPLLWQHITVQPIGRYVRTVKHTEKALKATFELADIPLARDAAALVELGALRMSHAFIPDPDTIEPLEDGGYYFGAFDIYEASLVSVPSNVDAVITAYSRKQLKTPLVRRWAKKYFERRRKPIPTRLNKNERLAERLESAEKSEGNNRMNTMAAEQTKGIALPNVPGFEGSWEWTQALLGATVEEFLRNAGRLSPEGWGYILATWDGSAVVAAIEPNRPSVEDLVLRAKWEYDDETGQPKWVGQPELVDVRVTVRERSILLAQERGVYKGYLRRARRPKFDGTEETPWSKPTLSDYRAGLNLPEDAQWEDLTQAQKQRIVEHTLIGSADADTFAEANAFPVVNPRTGKLNANALRNAIARAPQANIPAETAQSIQSVARRLLDENFREERSYDILERDLYYTATKESWEKLQRTAENLLAIAHGKRREQDRAELEELLAFESELD